MKTQSTTYTSQALHKLLGMGLKLLGGAVVLVLCFSMAENLLFPDPMPATLVIAYKVVLSLYAAVAVMVVAVATWIQLRARAKP